MILVTWDFMAAMFDWVPWRLFPMRREERRHLTVMQIGFMRVPL